MESSNYARSQYSILNAGDFTCWAVICQDGLATQTVRDGNRLLFAAVGKGGIFVCFIGNAQGIAVAQVIKGALTDWPLSAMM